MSDSKSYSCPDILCCCALDVGQIFTSLSVGRRFARNFVFTNFFVNSFYYRQLANGLWESISLISLPFCHKYVIIHLFRIFYRSNCLVD